MALLISSSVIGAVLPDIDHPDSHVGRRHRVASSVINSATGHRGFFHSPLCLAILYFGMKYLYMLLMGSAIGKIFESFLMWALLALSGFFLALLKHRSISVVPLILAASGLFGLFNNGNIDQFFETMHIGVTAGYASHLFLDFLTVGGIPLFYPVIKRPYHMLNLRSGKSDIYVIIVLLLVTVAVLFRYFSG